MKTLAKTEKSVDPVRERRKKTVVAIICLLSIVAFFVIFAIPMGVGQSLNTLMNTAYHVLMNTVFYLMAIAVIAGAISELLS